MRVQLCSDFRLNISLQPLVSLPANLLALVLAQGEHIHALPGTSSEAHLIEDLQASGLQLPPELLVKADELINRQTVKGARYPAGAQADIDTEDFADE